MKHLLFIMIISLLPAKMCGQYAASNKKAKEAGDLIESTSYNDDKRGTVRVLQYRPDREDFVCVNGKNRYTRALYGSHTAFRLETSDRPVFAVYEKRNSKNIRFRLYLKDGSSVALDSTVWCEARYTPGRRSYRVKHSSWGKNAELRIDALALPDEDAVIWKFAPVNMPKGAFLRAYLSEIRFPKLSRNGDMGADPLGCFDAPEHPQHLQTVDIALISNNQLIGKHVAGSSTYLDKGKDVKQKIVPKTKTAGAAVYLLVRDYALQVPSLKEGAGLYAKSEQARVALASRIQIKTPDPYFNTLGGALAVAADGIWDGEVWLHGAVGWRMPLSGWRAAYVGDILGWHDRARTHFNAYAASQVTTVPNTIPHPAQDSALALARAVKKWGTPMYSNGYICRNPHRDNQMHHYDMNLCYIDELLWHLNWTGDLNYARKIWPVIKRSLAWEKRNYDPDDDGLYDAYACIWASDALYYNSGAVTHSSAYNYRANRLAAMIAEKIGEDPVPYKKEAEKILNALNKRLWMPAKGHWAEYQDFMGRKRLHESAAVWTIYHSLDSDIADPFQAYQAMHYVDTEIPHISVRGTGLEDEGYATVSTTNWLPYSWSINNVAFAEVMHTALAYFQAGRDNAGFKLLKSSVLDGMYLGDSPGNFGQISFYDAARGECYRDFGDPIGVASRALIEGLYGILPDAMNGRLLVKPGFPDTWRYASLHTPDIDFDYEEASSGRSTKYSITHHLQAVHTMELRLPVRYPEIKSLTVNGTAVKWNAVEHAVGRPEITVTLAAPSDAAMKVRIEWKGRRISLDEARRLSATYLRESSSLKEGSPVSKEGLSSLKSSASAKTGHSDENNPAVKVCPNSDKSKAKTLSANSYDGMEVVDAAVPSRYISSDAPTKFVRVKEGQMEWWEPVDRCQKQLASAGKAESFAHVVADQCEPVSMDGQFNALVTDIFHNQYLSPRSPYTTLELPKQGIGEWCHPLTTANIDDSGLRAGVRDNQIDTALGIPFRTPAKGRNIAFTSLWDNYPDSLNVTLSGRASRAYLLMAGSTNHMQCHIDNGLIRIYYTDGTSDVLPLVNPDNWPPIEQVFFEDGQAFNRHAPSLYRLRLKTGEVSNHLGEELGFRGVTRIVDGGAAVLLEMPLNSQKTLSHLTLETLSNDVVIGLMSITLQR
jgi:hypothetical protein